MPLLSVRSAFYAQCTILMSLIVYAYISGRFPIIPSIACALCLSAVASQYLCCKIAHIAFSPLSSMITACSLTLLLRTHSIPVACAAACLAVTSKFIFRVEGRHIFNPANLALALIPLCFPAWISPGQWGQDVVVILLLCCAGVAVTGGVQRLESAFIFLFGYMVFILTRAYYLGDPASVAVHQLQHAGLILFAFFMLSDPATTPKKRDAKIIFSIAVLVATLVFQFVFYIPAAFIYALITVCALRGASIKAAVLLRRFTMDRMLIQ